MNKYTIFLLFATLASFLASADNLIMVRSKQSFPEAMLTLQSSISKHGYKVTRVQRIDVGLTGMGYKTDKYRVVFFAKADEFKYLVKKYPLIAAYMPPKISIFAEDDSTILVTANPLMFLDVINDVSVQVIFKRWERDIYSIFKDIHNAD